MLCDRLACSVNHNLIQQKLLSEGLPLTLKKALSIAVSVELAINQSLLLNQNQQQAPVSREEPINIFKTNNRK